MDVFKVSILGCGSAKPTLRHNPSAQIVNFRDNLFLVDCGEGTQLQMLKMKVKVNRMHHIFISHLHGDHCYGLPGLLSTLGLMGAQGSITIHLPKGGMELFKPMTDFAVHNMDIIYEPYEYGNHVIYEDKSLTVNTMPLKHRMECVGFVFREKPQPRHIIREMVDFHQVPIRCMKDIKDGADFVKEDGTVVPNEVLTKPADKPRVYAYISDTLPLKAVSSEVKNADLLYHEATFGNADAPRAQETCHSTALQAATVAKNADVKRLIIGHYSSRYKEEQDLLKEAQTVFPNTVLANEGLTFDV